MHHVPWTMLTSITKLFFLGGYRTMEHGPCSMTSITKLFLLGGYDMLTSRIFLDFNWITSITKFKICTMLTPNHVPCTMYHVNPNPKVWWKYWTPWSNIVLFRFKSVQITCFTPNSPRFTHIVLLLSQG